MEITEQVYSLVKRTSLKHDFGLSDQLKRASISIAANIAEGFGKYGRKEFCRFLLIARGSCFEVATLLKLAGRIDHSLTPDLAPILQRVELEIAKLTALRNHLSKLG